MVARRFIADTWWIAFAAVLFFCSTPVLTGFLVLSSGIQGLVFAGILAILEVYFQYREREDSRWLIVLAVLMFVGPWVREFVGLAALLVLAIEVFDHRRSVVSAIAIAGLAHAVFPTAIAHLFVPTLPVQPIFAFGNLGNRLAVGEQHHVWDGLSALHWRLPLHLASILPPSLAFGTLLLFGHNLLKRRVTRSDTYLIGWFAAAFVPFLKLFYEQVHLAYSLIPLSIFVARQWRTAYKGTVRRPAQLLIVGVICIAVVDQTLNVWVVRGATAEIYRGITRTADHLRHRYPLGTIVVSNAHLLEDVRFYAGGHIDPWGFPGGIPDQSHWLTSSAAYEALVAANSHHPMLLFDVHMPDERGQPGANRQSQALLDVQVPVEDLGSVYSVNYTYPTIDPLRAALLPIDVSTWPGPPDLEFNFYRGPSLSGRFGWREVSADFHLYRILGYRLALWTQPTVLERDYRGFTIIGYINQLHAIQGLQGEFSFDRLQQHGYMHAYTGSSIEDIREWIDAYCIAQSPPC
jgi:hypothetical protein